MARVSAQVDNAVPSGQQRVDRGRAHLLASALRRLRELPLASAGCQRGMLTNFTILYLVLILDIDICFLVLITVILSLSTDNLVSSERFSKLVLCEATERETSV